MQVWSPTARAAAGALPRGLPQLLLELLSLDRYVPGNSGEFAVITFSPETEEILRAKAAQTGRTPDEILREVLSRTGDVAPWRNSVAPPPENLTRDELIAGMEAIAVRSAARPVVDPRSIDEIIGYDDFGLPR